MDSKQRALLQASGRQPYSVKIGDKYYQYNRPDPLGLMMGITADSLQNVPTSPHRILATQLAAPETTTDDDYARVTDERDAIIAGLNERERLRLRVAVGCLDRVLNPVCS